MQTVSRRGFLVIGGTGAAGAVLAGCGGSEDDPRGEGRDPELLAAALAAETALGDAYTSARAPGGDGAALGAFATASEKRGRDLESLLTDAGGSAEEIEPSTGAGDPIESANAAIATYREAAGPLSTEQLRGTAIAFIVAVAAELSVLLDVTGEDPAPRAFVTGLPGEPYVAGDEDSAADEEAETTTTQGDETTTEGQP